MYSNTEILTFSQLFNGAKDFYGVAAIDRGRFDEDKQKLEVDCSTVHNTPSPALFTNHLNGTVSIGISPLKGDNTVDFAAIDIDNYEGDVLKVVRAIYYFNFPICPCYSKSKHLHLYFFFPGAPVEEALEIVKWYANAFNCPKKVEIFPKQTKREEKAKALSWINLPYFDANNPDNCRKMLTEDLKLASLEDFLERAVGSRHDIEWHRKQIETIMCHDAPPCILKSYILGDVGAGGRNNWLFSVAVYLRLKDENCDLDEQLSDINARLDDPLPEEELRQTVLSSMKKDTYFYLCNQMPRCDKASCLRLEYGVGSKQSSGLSYGQLTQILTDPPSYEWVVNGQTMFFQSEREIMGQEAFRQLCMRMLHIVPRRLPEDKWAHILTKASANIEIRQPVMSEDDFDVGSILLSHLATFFLDKRRAQDISQLKLGRVLEDKQAGKFYFSAQALLSFLVDNKQFKSMSNMEIRNRLITMGAEKIGWYWSMPIDSIPQDENRKKVNVGNLSTGEGESNDF